jgi:Zn-dependent protease
MVFGKRIRLFRLFGFDVRVDLSWLIIAVLVTWSLAEGVFPAYYEDLTTATYWWMGVLGAVGLFVSVIIHEFSHSLVARRFGLPMGGITLFVFGGIAEMEDEPENPKTEFLMALAGPAASVVLGLLLLGISAVIPQSVWPLPLFGVVSYLGFINLVLAGFNLLPAFPLDGGRLLRAAFWRWKGDLRSATRIASGVGSVLGLGLIGLGIVFLIQGAFIGGIWWALIGLFVRQAAAGAYQNVLVRGVLSGKPVRHFVNTEPVTVPSTISVRELVEDYIYRHHFKMFPVVDDGSLQGCITTGEVKGIPRDAWSEERVGNHLDACSSDNTVTPDTDALQALRTMQKTKKSRLLVVEDGELVGVLTLKDMLDFLSLKLDLEQDVDSAR